MSHSHLFRTLFVTTVICLLSACQSGIEKRIFTANNIAATAGLTKQEVPTGHFKLATYSRVLNPALPLRVYIEGDGFAWVNKFRLSNNPTPKEPLALTLAADDDYPNILYIARPCQYISLSSDPLCSPNYWSGSRFSPEVIESTNQVIDHFVERLHNQKTELIGFSGGGAVAVLVAAARDDVSLLRTVAGNLDHNALHTYHDVTQLDDSLNPIDAIDRVKNIPQIHFSGEKDTVVPPFIAKAFVDKINNSEQPHACAITAEQPGFTHHEGWLNKWRKLLRTWPKCS